MLPALLPSGWRSDSPRLALVAADRSSDLKALDGTLTSIEKVLDLPKLREELVDLEEQAGMPGLWDDQEKAQRITGRMSVVQADLKRLESYRSRLEDLGVLYEMAVEEGDEGTAEEADRELEALAKEIGSV